MSGKKQSDGFGELSFEEGMAELERLVERLESPNVGLEESLALYERGHALQQHLAQVLKSTELRIEKISQSSRHSTPQATPQSTTADTPTPSASSPDDVLPF